VAELAVTDLEGEDKGKLEGHLKSPDFLQVDKYQSKLRLLKLNRLTLPNLSHYPALRIILAAILL
jgi:hypothetical protein